MYTMTCRCLIAGHCLRIKLWAFPGTRGHQLDHFAFQDSMDVATAMPWYCDCHIILVMFWWSWSYPNKLSLNVRMKTVSHYSIIHSLLQKWTRCWTNRRQPLHVKITIEKTYIYIYSNHLWHMCNYAIDILAHQNPTSIHENRYCQSQL